MKKTSMFLFCLLQLSYCFTQSPTYLSQLKNLFTKEINEFLHCIQREQTCDPHRKKIYQVGALLAGALGIALATGVGIYLFKKDSLSSNALAQAIREFDTAKLHEIITDPRTDINKILPNGKTPLTLAVVHRNPTLVELLLNNGAQIDQPDKEHHTPFYYAIFATFPSAEVNKILMQHGANIQITDKLGNTPLLATIKDVMSKEDTDIAQMLINHGADTTSPDAKGYTPLHKAVLYNHGNLARTLIQKGADVNTPNKKGTPPLITAAKKNLADMVDILLAAPSIDIHARDAQGKAALDLAGRPAIKQSLLTKSLLYD